jgi:hypothetical protein
MKVSSTAVSSTGLHSGIAIRHLHRQSGRTRTTALDAVLYQPLLESLALAGGGHGQAVVRSFAPDRRTATIAAPGSGRTRATSYDAAGRAAAEASSSGPQVSISIPSGGFAIVVR